MITASQLKNEFGLPRNCAAKQVLNAVIRLLPGGNELLDTMEAIHQLCNSFTPQSSVPIGYQSVLDALRSAKKELEVYLYQDCRVPLPHVPKGKAGDVLRAGMMRWPSFMLMMGAAGQLAQLIHDPANREDLKKLTVCQAHLVNGVAAICDAISGTNPWVHKIG